MKNVLVVTRDNNDVFPLPRERLYKAISGTLYFTAVEDREVAKWLSRFKITGFSQCPVGDERINSVVKDKVCFSGAENRQISEWLISVDAHLLSLSLDPVIG